MGIFRIFTALLFLGAFSMNAQAVLINPDQCGGTLTCWDVNTTPSLDADDVETKDQFHTSPSSVVYQQSLYRPLSGCSAPR